VVLRSTPIQLQGSGYPQEMVPLSSWILFAVQKKTGGQNTIYPPAAVAHAQVP